MPQASKRFKLSFVSALVYCKPLSVEAVQQERVQAGPLIIDHLLQRKHPACMVLNPKWVPKHKP